MDKSKNESYRIILDENGKAKYVKKRNFMKPFDYINYAFFILYGLLCLFPVIYQVLMSFASRADFLNSTLITLPRHFNLEAYKSILYKNRVGRAFMISVFLTVVGSLYSVILTCLGGYVFTRRDTPGLRIVFNMMIFTMFFGGGLIPFYFVCKGLFGTDNLAVLIFPFGAGTFNIIILRNFFSQVPDSIVESCRLDGASEFTILFRFIIPLSKAGIATVLLFTIVGRWDDWYWPMIFITRREDLYPLALELRSVLVMGESGSAGGVIEWEKIFTQGRNAAMIVISLFPIMCIYPVLQKYFTKGVMIGGVKG